MLLYSGRNPEQKVGADGKAPPFAVSFVFKIKATLFIQIIHREPLINPGFGDVIMLTEI